MAVSIGVQRGYGCRDYVSTQTVVLLSISPFCPACPFAGTGKPVGNKWKSVLTKSILTVLSNVEINRDSAGTRKKVWIQHVYVMIESIIMKFYWISVVPQCNGSSPSETVFESVFIQQPYLFIGVCFILLCSFLSTNLSDWLGRTFWNNLCLCCMGH